MHLMPMTIGLAIVVTGSVAFMTNYQRDRVAVNSDAVSIAVVSAVEKAIKQQSVVNSCDSFEDQLNPFVPERITAWRVNIKGTCWVDISVTLSLALEPQTLALHVGNARLGGQGVGAQQVSWSLPLQTQFSLQAPYHKWLKGAHNPVCGNNGITITCQNP